MPGGSTAIESTKWYVRWFNTNSVRSSAEADQSACATL